MNKNLKVLLSALAVAALGVAPAVAKSRTQLHYAAPDVVYRNSTDIRDYVTGQSAQHRPRSANSLAVATPKQVWMIWERDHFARRVYLTDKHSEHVKPSWFGELIGHYEGGDTVVVDTIGLAAGQNDHIDFFRTPHTEKLHVVERFTISQDIRALTAVVTVEDPELSTGRSHLNRHGARTRWRWRRWFAPRTVDDHFNENLHPIPQADKPDFDAEA